MGYTRITGEVDQLAGSFNNMLNTLQTTMDQLVHKENLASLGQLAAGVAHELNNPLATVLLYADILRREYTEDDPHWDDIKTIVRETNRCKTIVAALLDFARQHQVEAQVINLNTLIQTIILVESKHAIYKDINFQTELAPKLPEIQADPDQLQAVFINLLTNAAEGCSLVVSHFDFDNFTVEVFDTSATGEARIYLGSANDEVQIIAYYYN